MPLLERREMKPKDKVWVFGVHPGVITKGPALNATTGEPHYQVAWKDAAGTKFVAYVHETDLWDHKRDVK